MRGCPLLLVGLGLLAVLIAPSIASAVTTPGGISSYYAAVIRAPTRTVIFVYPAISGPKPLGVSGATYFDRIAIGTLIGLEIDRQYQTQDTNSGSPLFINTATGQPGTTNTPIVAVGRPTIHAVVYWLEKKSMISPVYYAEDGFRYYFRKRIDGSTIISQSKTALFYDHFVIYTVTDSAGNTYYVFYGFSFKGSSAATKLLKYWVQEGQLGSRTSSYEVWKWVDTNRNFRVDPPGVDTYTQIASG